MTNEDIFTTSDITLKQAKQELQATEITLQAVRRLKEKWIKIESSDQIPALTRAYLLEQEELLKEKIESITKVISEI